VSWQWPGFWDPASGFWTWPEQFYEGESYFGEEYDEEVWVYETALDERVCPICGPLEGEAFLGEDVDANFPEASDIDETTLAPNLHDNCRCQLVLAEEYEGKEEY